MWRGIAQPCLSLPGQKTINLDEQPTFLPERPFSSFYSALRKSRYLHILSIHQIRRFGRQVSRIDDAIWLLQSSDAYAQAGPSRVKCNSRSLLATEPNPTVLLVTRELGLV
jgi:hypothetical protein